MCTDQCRKSDVVRRVRNGSVEPLPRLPLWSAMSVEQKVRVANAVQIFCGAALLGLLIAWLLAQLDPNP
jgi:hypothetical protein